MLRATYYTKFINFIRLLADFEKKKKLFWFYFKYLQIFQLFYILKILETLSKYAEKLITIKFNILNLPTGIKETIFLNLLMNR